MKKILTILLALLCIFSLTACGSGSDENTTDEKVKITVWNYYSDHQLEYFQSVINDFNASQDKYEVVYEGQTKDYLDNVAQAVMAQVGPDFLIEYGSYASQWNEDGLVYDLSKYLDQETIDNLTDSAYAYATGFEDGGMYVYPVIGTGTVLWYIPEALDAAGVEVPETWDEMFAAAKKIHDTVTVVTDEEGLHYVTDGSGTEITGWTSYMDETLRLVAEQTGGCYDVETNELLFNNEKVVAWLKKFQEACQEGYVASTYVNGYANTDQEAGLTAMGSSSVAGRPYYSTLTPGTTHELQMNMSDTANFATCARSRGIIALNNGDEEKVKGVVEFIKFFTQPEYNTEFCEVMNYYAVLKNTLATDEYKEFEANNPDFPNVMAEYGSYYPSTPTANYVKQALKSVMGSVAAGEDPQTAIDAAIAEFNANK